ncbi:hypothetical protein M422DRAFT_257618 [Sphaerobolus stellatus SS14]|uniref:Metallo-beta-lactamase domain-containing protein n=1 Tax=Sphaerobolus stellatus (strain SS14) TaxID=990650 RepID=A0A0C9VP24_SPHS4|nr:hypothetical protein M422DRAFT_257618 [Sphaerobolus stellatus SS14]
MTLVGRKAAGSSVTLDILFYAKKQLRSSTKRKRRDACDSKTKGLPHIFVVAVALQGAPHAELKADRPSHHANDAATRFTNPWPQRIFLIWIRTEFAVRSCAGTRGALIGCGWKTPPIPNNVTELIGFKPPAWNNVNNEPKKFKATWLGHACFLFELPTSPGAARGPWILFDPVFSHRCGLISWLGPGRITPPACPVQQLPEVDGIVISHYHYNHLAIPAIKSVVFPTLHRPPHPHLHPTKERISLPVALSLLQQLPQPRLVAQPRRHRLAPRCNIDL